MAHQAREQPGEARPGQGRYRGDIRGEIGEMQGRYAQRLERPARAVQLGSELEARRAAWLGLGLGLGLGFGFGLGLGFGLRLRLGLGLGLGLALGLGVGLGVG